MAVHEHHGHGSTTVVDSDREGPAMALIVLIVLAVVALMIWFFAFSGIVIDRDTGTTDRGPGTNIEQNFEDNTTNVPGGGSEPQPTST